MKRRALLLLLPLLTLASCGSVNVDPATDLTPYRENSYVGINGTTYSSSAGGSILAYTFGADAVLYRWLSVGKITWAESAVAQYYIESPEQFYYNLPNLVPGAPGAREHVHFYVDEANIRCCYFESSPRIVYKAQ